MIFLIIHRITCKCVNKDAVVVMVGAGTRVLSADVILRIIKKITKSPSSRISQFYQDFFSHRELPRAVREILLPITADERGQRRCHGPSASHLNTPCYRQDSPTDSTRCFAQTPQPTVNTQPHSSDRLAANCSGAILQMLTVQNDAE